MSKNVIIGQSGGPTAVINSSLAGVYKAACSLGADKVYGMKYGIEGLLKEEMLELNVLLDDRMSIELLKRTPSSYLGSCRFKLPDGTVVTGKTGPLLGAASSALLNALKKLAGIDQELDLVSAAAIEPIQTLKTKMCIRDRR